MPEPGRKTPDPTFRAALLVIADFAKYSQLKSVKRLFIAGPLLVAGYVISLATLDVF